MGAPVAQRVVSRGRACAQRVVSWERVCAQRVVSRGRRVVSLQGLLRNASCHGGGSVKNRKKAWKIVMDFEASFLTKVRLAQWLACWAHNPKVLGSNLGWCFFTMRVGVRRFWSVMGAPVAQRVVSRGRACAQRVVSWERVCAQRVVSRGRVCAQRVVSLQGLLRNASCHGGELVRNASWRNTSCLGGSVRSALCHGGGPVAQRVVSRGRVCTQRLGATGAGRVPVA